MNNYDFKSLSDFDFELLVRDLLQEELDFTLESFKPGKDGGIDLRYISNRDSTLIVQCKHYASSTISQLLFLLHSVESSGRFAISPSMLKTPSVKINFSAPLFDFSILVLTLPMSLCK